MPAKKRVKNSQTSSSSAKKNKSLIFNYSSYVSKELQEHRTHWNSSEFKSDNVFITKTPFPFAQYRNLIQNEENLLLLLRELKDLELNSKNNDLYQFSQSNELKNIHSPLVKAFKDFMYGSVKDWISKLTNIEELSNVVDMFYGRYDYTDYLSCHDDQCDERRIAFIFYLVPPSWTEKDGGFLDLMSTDDKGQPIKIMKSILPSWNSFSFFEVSPISFHRVSEVLTKNESRLSIGGWFHGPYKSPLHISSLPSSSSNENFDFRPPLLSPIIISKEEFIKWINPAYLSPKTLENIRESFEENSEISLQNFLHPKQLSAVQKALKSIQYWRKMGPYNRRNYESLACDALPEILKELLNFLQSESMFDLLYKCTGLFFSENENSESSVSSFVRKSVGEFRRWSHGSYTLLADSEKKEVVLDARLFFNVSETLSLGEGGYGSYFARNEDEELLTVSPSSNALALVYRDEETFGFVKYVNDKINSHGREFHDVFLHYYE